ncbi:MAG: methyltransferase domain-containing protein [Bryobacteraceae bacterium]|jgi:ubiquinone/menaquinone biosynthesis C-methylase UbiE
MKKTLRGVAGLAAGAVLFVVSAQAWWIQPPRSAGEPRKLAPYVVSPISVVDKMLEAASLRRGEVLYDLGCGDGRIVLAAAKNFGARAVGVEISESLVKLAREQAESQGLQNQVKIIAGDMLNVDLSQANVVSLYLMTEANDTLRPKLERELKPGARVVSLEFKMRGWKPSHVEKVELHNHPYMIYVYEMPQR